MIWNPIRPYFPSSALRQAGCGLLALYFLSCNKSSNIDANKAYIGLTHVAYGLGPVNVLLNREAAFGIPIAFGSTSGASGNPYDTITSRVSDMDLVEYNPDSLTILRGNQAFQQGARYSLFVFDSTGAPDAGLIIFQDNRPIRTLDSFTYIRYLNFSPGTTLGLYLYNGIDTIRSIALQPFVARNPNPALYSFLLVKRGFYAVRAYADSINTPTNFRMLDSLHIDSAINYNIYLQGNFSDTSTGNKLKLISQRLNN